MMDRRVMGLLKLERIRMGGPAGERSPSEVGNIEKDRLLGAYPVTAIVSVLPWSIVGMRYPLNVVVLLPYGEVGPVPIAVWWTLKEGNAIVAIERTMPRMPTARDRRDLIFLTTISVPLAELKKRRPAREAGNNLY
jgi:hypothetical protein